VRHSGVRLAVITRLVTIDAVYASTTKDCQDIFGKGRLALYVIVALAVTIVIMVSASVTILRLVPEIPHSAAGTAASYLAKETSPGRAAADIVAGRDDASDALAGDDASMRMIDDENDDDPAERFEGSLAGEAPDVRKPLLTTRGTAVLIVSMGFVERALDDDSADQAAGQFLSDIASAAVVNEGHLSHSTADSVLVTFNTASPVLEHEMKAVAFIDAVMVKDSARFSVFAVASGAIVVNPNVKPMTVMGPCIDVVSCLHRLQVTLEIPAIATEVFVFAADRVLKNRTVPVDIVQFPDQPAETVFEVLLQQLYPGDGDQLRAVMSLMSNCSFERAARLLASMPRPDKYVDRLLARCVAAKQQARPRDGRYARRYMGWETLAHHDDHADATVSATSRPSDSNNDSSLGETRGTVVNLTLPYDGLPPDFRGSRNEQWLRSDKVVGTMLGCTIFGGMSEEGTPVAVLAVDESVEANKQLADEVVRHVRVATRLEHPGVVTVHAAARINARWLLLVEEYLPGGDLAWMLREFAPLPATAIRRLAKELLNILRHLNHRRVVHGHINWSVLRVGLDGTLKLTWFSAGVELSNAQSQREASLQTSLSALEATAKRAGEAGAASCVAPELRGYGVGMGAHANSDMYSFGCIVLSLFLGKEAIYDGSAVLDVPTAVSRCEAVPVDLRADLIDLVQGCLREDPRQRVNANEAAFHRFFSSKA
jgi:serine/threonine protein kinase